MMTWISVKTSLPAVNTRVFIYVPRVAGEASRGFFTATLGHPEDGEGNILSYYVWWYEDSWFDFDDVTHWMLPEKPK